MHLHCRHLSQIVFLVVILFGAAGPRCRCYAQDVPPADASPTTAKTAAPVASAGEKVPSEDSVIKDLHSLGLINGYTNIFRSASPVRDLVDSSGAVAQNAKDEARARLQHLHDLGIRTIISFETPDEPESQDGTTDQSKAKRIQACVKLEKNAAAEVGIDYVSDPISNSGKNSLEDMSDDAVYKLLNSVSGEIFQHAKLGGVLFHCSAGHDRTGIVAAYMRMKYQHWPVDQAIDEMRRNGHNWPKFSHDGGACSWHEEHLRAIDKLLSDQTH
jgi:Tyrosine phosphatase family